MTLREQRAERLYNASALLRGARAAFRAMPTVENAERYAAAVREHERAVGEVLRGDRKTPV